MALISLHIPSWLCTCHIPTFFSHMAKIPGPCLGPNSKSFIQILLKDDKEENKDGGAATAGHIRVCGSCCLQRPRWSMGSLMQPGTFVSCCSRGCVYVCCLVPLEAMLTSVVCAAAGSNVDVHGPCFCQGPVCPRGHVDVAYYAIARNPVEVYECKEWGNYLCSDIDDCRFTVENDRHWGILWNTPAPQSLDRKPLNRKLWNIWWSVVLHSWWPLVGVEGEEGLSFL